MEKITVHDRFFVKFDGKDEYDSIVKLFCSGEWADHEANEYLEFQYDNLRNAYAIYLSDVSRAFRVSRLVGCPMFTYTEFMAIVAVRNRKPTPEPIVNSEDSEGDALMKFFAAEPGTWGGYSGV